jgi:hypothetical protein
MTPEEEAYAETRRCIREANETGAWDFVRLSQNLPNFLDAYGSNGKHKVDTFVGKSRDLNGTSRMKKRE